MLEMTLPSTCDRRDSRIISCPWLRLLDSCDCRRSTPHTVTLALVTRCSTALMPTTRCAQDDRCLLVCPCSPDPLMLAPLD